MLGKNNQKMSKSLIFVSITEPPFDFDRGYHKLHLKKRKCNKMYFICNISTKNK